MSLFSFERLWAKVFNKYVTIIIDALLGTSYYILNTARTEVVENTLVPVPTRIHRFSRQ